jgi:hypothetical protein
VGQFIDQVKGGDVNEALDAAVGKVKRASRKLGRYHPDAEVLPLKRWGGIEELGILAGHEHRKWPDMSEDEVSEWENRVVQAMRDHTEEVVSELKKCKAEIEGHSPVGPALRRVGEIWHLSYPDDPPANFTLQGNQFLGWLAKLLSRPDHPWTVAELCGDPEGRLAADALLGGERVTDRKGLQKIDDRIQEIDATAAGMGEMYEALEEERDRLLRQVKKYAANERVKTTVGKAYRNITTQKRQFLGKLESLLPQLASHLRACIKSSASNYTIFYRPPAGAPRWEIENPSAQRGFTPRKTFLRLSPVDTDTTRDW